MENYDGVVFLVYEKWWAIQDYVTDNAVAAVVGAFIKIVS